MFGAPINSGLSLTKVLGGISKTLAIANQVIPLYKEAKPMINNARNIFSVLKDINKGVSNKSSTNKTSNNSSNNETKKDTILETRKVKQNNPSFFL